MLELSVASLHTLPSKSLPRVWSLIIRLLLCISNPQKGRLIIGCLDGEVVGTHPWPTFLKELRWSPVIFCHAYHLMYFELLVFFFFFGFSIDQKFRAQLPVDGNAQRVTLWIDAPALSRHKHVRIISSWHTTEKKVLMERIAPLNTTICRILSRQEHMTSIRPRSVQLSGELDCLWKY